MGTTVEKLNKVLETKEAIRNGKVDSSTLSNYLTYEDLGAI